MRRRSVCRCIQAWRKQSRIRLSNHSNRHSSPIRLIRCRVHCMHNYPVIACARDGLRAQNDFCQPIVFWDEASSHIVKNYLGHVTRLGACRVLLRNLREGKPLRKDDWVGMDIPTLGDDYLAMLPGFELVARNVWPFECRTVDGYQFERRLLRCKA